MSKKAALVAMTGAAILATRHKIKQNIPNILRFAQLIVILQRQNSKIEAEQ
jgi:hypothetical protein